MDLLCVERIVTDNQVAERDPVIFRDMRVIHNLLHLESKYLPKCDYFNQIQDDVKPYMRRLVGNWMLEVCEEQSCENQVFPLAINFLDRFLCVCPIIKSQLQLSAAVCLLLASKIRQCHALSVQLICFYAENSISATQLRAWEILVVSKLSWEICGVTGFDFVDHLVERLPNENKTTWPLLRSHAHTLLALGYAEPDFIGTKSSVMGAASVIAASRGLRMESEIEDQVFKMTNTNANVIDPVVVRLEMIISAGASKMYQRMEARDPGNPESPKDVHFVHF